MPEQYVKNQHYIPQCVLANFANEDDQVFESLVEVGRVYQTNIRNSMSESHTYEHEYLERNSLEIYFSRIEDYIGPAIRKIIETVRAFERSECGFEDIKKIIGRYMREFIIFYYRSGALLTEYEFEHRSKKNRVYALLKNIMNSKYLKALSKTINDYYEIAIIKSANKDFLLSDQYVSTVALSIKNRFYDRSNRHMGMKEVLILIPLSAEYYIALYLGKIPDYIERNRINLLSQAQIEEINGVIVNNSYRKCVGFREEPIRIALSKFEFSSPSNIYSGNDSGIFMGATLKKEVFFYQHDKESWEMFIGHDWMKLSKLGRNDLCACGSEKKFKRCCEEHFKVCKRMMDDIVSERGDYSVSQYGVVEKPISDFHNR